MNCPKCKTPSLKSLEPYSTLPPFRCTTCGGFWVTMDKIASFDALIAPYVEPAGGEGLSKELDSMGGLCPYGHGLLSRTKMELDSVFYLDRCVTCGGVWFDKGEWEHISTAHLLDEIGSFWSKEWQKKQRELHQEKEYLKWANGVFGEELLAKLLETASLLTDHPSRVEALAFIKNKSER